MSTSLISPEILKAHRATWFVWAGGVKMRRQATMRGFWGYDVTCSCGFKTRTGGATRRTVEDMLLDHRMDAQGDADVLATRCPECHSAPGTACYFGAEKLNYMHPRRWNDALKTEENQ